MFKQLGLIIVLMGMTMATFAQETKQVQGVPTQSIPGLSPDDMQVIMKIEKLMQELNQDPAFKKLVSQLAEVNLKIRDCKSGKDKSAGCQGEYVNQRSELYKQAEQMRDKKLEPIKAQLLEIQKKLKTSQQSS